MPPTLQPATGYYDGSDYNTFFPDGSSGLSFDVITDPRTVVAQHVMRRWILEQGDLDITYIGAGIRQWLNASVTQNEIDELSATLRNSALGVDGLADITIEAASTQQGSLGVTLTISASITLTRKLGGETYATVFELTADTARLIVAGEIT